MIVQWIEPLRDGGTPILHYEYCLRQKSQCNGHWVEIPDSAPGGDNHGLYEITRSNGTFTRVYLRAVNDQGAGHSFDYSTVPLAGAPAAPTNLRAEAPSSEYVKISWNEPRARSGATIIGYSLERSRDGVTWAHDPYCQFPYCDQQYLGHGRHPRGTNSIMTRIGEDATLYYRIRTFFHTNTPTIVNDIDFSRGASPSSPIITVTTVGATGILALPTIGVTGGHGREGANNVIVFDLWITGGQQRTTPVTVIYRTVDLRARAGSDYSTRSGLLTFAPTDTEKTVSVPIIDDAVEDSGEEFILRLSNASGALIARAGAFGTITNTEESLTGFTLVNAATETDIGGVDDGDTVTLDDPADGQYGIRVETAPKNRREQRAPQTLRSQDHHPHRQRRSVHPLRKRRRGPAPGRLHAAGDRLSQGRPRRQCAAVYIGVVHGSRGNGRSGGRTIADRDIPRQPVPVDSPQGQRRPAPGDRHVQPAGAIVREDHAIGIVDRRNGALGEPTPGGGTGERLDILP